MKRLLLVLCLLASPLAAQPSRFSLATQVQPGFATTALGDTYYAANATTFGRIPPNTTSTRKFWMQASSAISWETLVSGDIPNNAANTTGSAAKWTTARLLAGNSVDGSANATFANKFVLQGTTDAGMTAAQFLGALGTGILKNTTTTGVLSIAAAADIPSLLTTKGDLSCFTTLPTRKAVGTTDYVLTADPTDACGFNWKVGGGGGGSGITSINTDTTGAQVIAAGTGISVATVSGTTTITNTGSGGGGSGGYAGTLWIRPDPNFSTGTSYERVAYGVNVGLFRLKVAPQFSTTIANAKTSPPSGWSWDNSSLVVAADANTTTTNGLYISASVGSNYTTVPSAVPLIHRTTPYTTSNQDFLVRLASAMTVSNYSDERFVVYDQTSGKFASIGFDAGGNIVIGDGTYTSPGVTTTLTQRTNGVWLRLIRSGASFSGFYNLANQSTPPLTWTAVGATTASMAYTFAGFYADRYNSSYAITFSILYFDDQHLDQPEGTAAIGFDSTSPVLTLVSGFDLGASTATVTDANVRLALAEITNPREWDTATWTWSVSRGSSAPVSCGGGSYAAAASVAVGGTGRYLSVCGKAASTGNVLPASVNATALRIPFTP